MSPVVPVRLIKGSDDVLRGEAFTRALDEAVDGGDRSLLVDEFDLDHAKLAAAIDAAQTPPFLTDHRVVVVRRLGRFSKNDEVASLTAYLQDPSPTTALILVWEKTALTSANDDGEPFTRTPKQPPALAKAISACGGAVIDADPVGKNLGGWVDAQLAEAGLSVEPKARDRITDVLGEDAGALREIIERLKGTYGTGERLRLDDVVGCLGEAGGVAPWDLTDAIDSGDVARSLEMLGRMMSAGGRHGLAVMASLQTHYLRMARLDGAGVRGERDAAVVLGLKGSTFPAKKALALGRKLGPAKVRRAVELLAEADLDLRGGKAWPNELVMEVLVARLARLSR